ncbi:MAG: alpha-hydroxy-acid oxidizing protein [Phycisphaerales bacterium]|nr:alpha-hydroxy-acid oxidizing protein [Phycisphaerales bacterium]
MNSLLNTESFQALAQERLSKMAFDYYRSGAWGEWTLQANIDAWEKIRLLPRALVDVSTRDMRGQLLGMNLSFPMLIAPTAMQCMADPQGEVATARAAAKAGVPMVLSSLSTRSVEDVVTASSADVVMQIYISSDRGFTKALAQRAQAAGCKALMITVDTPVWGVRERDIHNGFRVPDGMSIVNLQRHGQPTGHSGSGIGDALGWTIDASLTWKDLDVIRQAVQIPIMVKGILRADDAGRAFDHGAAAVVVSNHGGRQLDGAAPTAEALPAIVRAVSDRGPIIVDGGIRRGVDIVRALALGANAVQVGRPILWGLAAGGETGVARVLQILFQEFDLAMALAGCADLSAVTADLICPRP